MHTFQHRCNLCFLQLTLLLNQILFTWQKLFPFESPFDSRSRISSNRVIISGISSLISCLLYRWHHHVWSRYRFSRPSRWSRHSFWPRVSFVSLFATRPWGTRHSCFSGFSRRSHGTLRTSLSLWSSPATWSPSSSGTRISGGTCRTDLLPWLTVLGRYELFKLFADFFSHIIYGYGSWIYVRNRSPVSRLRVCS